jgi:hypothetical protein
MHRVWRHDVALCTLQPTHSPELPRSVHGGIIENTSMLCCTWRQWRYVRWALRVNLAHFLDVYNPKIVCTGTFTWIIFINNLCLLKEENTPIHGGVHSWPIAMNTNSFPEIVNFLGLWAVVSDRSFTRWVPLIMGYVYCLCFQDKIRIYLEQTWRHSTNMTLDCSHLIWLRFEFFDQ